MAKKRSIEQINCTCKNDKTGSGPGAMFKANATDCQCQITSKKGTGPTTKVKRVAIAIG